MSDEWREYALEDVKVWFRYNTNTTLPIVRTDCFVCIRTCDPYTDGVDVSRINGDSRYGYEAYHSVCLDLMGAVQDMLCDTDEWRAMDILDEMRNED